MKLPEPAQLKTDIENRVGIETVQNHMRAYGKQYARDSLEAAAQELSKEPTQLISKWKVLEVIRNMAKEIA